MSFHIFSYTKEFKKLSAKTTSITRLYSSLSNDEYQFIQRSSVPTLHFQKSLPRLPIPALNKTCDRYVDALRPLLTESEFNKAAAIVKHFENGVGIDLHKELEANDQRNKHTSYISEPWFDMYLSDRTPLPINYNPALVYINDTGANNDQLVRTTNLIISSLRFYNSLKHNVLEPEVYHLNPKKSNNRWFRTVTGALPSSVSWYGAYLFKAYPLDMCQYSRLFNATRIPEIEKDRLFQDKKQRHILILKGGHFYTFDVIDQNGNIISPEVIYASIDKILKDNTPPSDCPIGILTTKDRDEWAMNRKHLEKIGNAETLRLIDGSLFAVSLDSDNLNDPVKMVKQYLHSDGTNRWFDKTFTLITSQNGTAGINFEHSWGDGVAVLRYFQDVYKDSTGKPFVKPGQNIVADADIRKLEFVIDEEVKKNVLNAKEQFNKVTNSLNTDYVRCDNIGKHFCKKHNISPDAVMQLGFQVAYYTMTKKLVSTYESCSTAAFKHGRTETVRPCTDETKRFCEALENENAVPSDELVQLVKDCSNKHIKLVREAAMGQGFDRHLFALKKIAEKRALKVGLFMDSSYQLINHNILSTSTLSSDVVLAGGFGPVVKDGFGIAYVIKKDHCGALITNYSDYTNGSAFKECLQKSFDRIYSIMYE